MADNNSIATLKDFDTSIKRSIEKVKVNFQKFNSASEASQKNTALRQVNDDHRNIKGNIDQMKMEITNLQDEANRKHWQKISADYSEEYESIKKQIAEKTKEKNAGNFEERDYNALDIKNMSCQKAFDTGDEVLRKDREAIARMKKITDKDLDTMITVNQELMKQNEKLENADKDLFEIDFSLARAATQLKGMMRMYATDKVVWVLGGLIVIVVIAIITVLCLQGPNEPVKSTPDDPFKKIS